MVNKIDIPSFRAYVLILTGGGAGKDGKHFSKITLVEQESFS